MKKFIIITIIALVYIVPLSFPQVRNSIKEQIQSAIMTVKNEKTKWVKVSDNIYLDTSSISKTKYLISGWFKIYDTPEDDLYTVNGVDVYYAIDKYEVDCTALRATTVYLLGMLNILTKIIIFYSMKKIPMG